MAEAIKQNTCLQSFTLAARGTQIDNQAGIALAEAIKQNTRLQSFTFEAWRTQIDNQTGIAMAEAIKRNACLQSFVFDVRDTQIDNQAGIFTLQKYLELQILLPREAAAFQELVHILGENVVNELSSDGRIACGKGIALSTYGCRPTTPNYHL